MSYQKPPTYEQAFVTGSGKTTSAWYRWFQQFWSGDPPSAESAIAVGASPFPYIAPSRGFVILTGGSVSAVQFTRQGVTNTTLTTGIFPLSRGDTLTVTYAGLPNMLWVPQ